MVTGSHRKTTDMVCVANASDRRRIETSATVVDTDQPGIGQEDSSCTELGCFLVRQLWKEIKQDQGGLWRTMICLCRRLIGFEPS